MSKHKLIFYTAIPFQNAQNNFSTFKTHWVIDKRILELKNKLNLPRPRPLGNLILPGGACLRLMLLVEVGRRDPLLVPHQPSQNLFTPRQARHQRWTRSFKQDYSPGSSCWLTWGRPPPKPLCPCWPLQCRMPGLHQDGGSLLYVEVTRAEGVFLLLTTLAGQRVPENTKNCYPSAWTETVFQTFPRLGLRELAEDWVCC